MTSTLFLRFALPALLVPALVALVLPSQVASSYVSVVQPAALFLAAGLSVWVALLYRDDLRRVFLLLTGFLVLYGLANLKPLTDWLERTVPDQLPILIPIWQLVDYAFILSACVFILRVMAVHRLNRAGWIVMILPLLIASYIVTAALYPSFAGSLQTLVTGRWGEVSDLFQLSFVDQIAARSLPVITYALVRTFDAAILLMLVPVLWLYVQNARAMHQESLTFTIVVFGIIASLIFVYVYELLLGDPLFEIASRDLRQGSLLDALYIFGYLTISAGLFAHRKHQEWSLDALNRILQ